MPEKHKLHNVRLDDEVWAAIKAMDCSLNQHLRITLLGNETRQEHHDPNWLWCERCQAWIETKHLCGARYKVPSERLAKARIAAGASPVPVREQEPRPSKPPLLKPSEKRK